MNYVFTGLLLALLCFSSCNRPDKNVNVEQQQFYDLEQVIEDEIGYLLSKNKGLDKTLFTGNKEENIVVTPSDTVAWRQQFSALIEANMNKVAYLNAFDRQETFSDQERQVVFSALDDSIPVQNFTMKYQNDQLVSIDIVFIERNLVYSHIKEMSITFDSSGKHFESFSISGKEKMILKSAFDYEVKAKIV